MKPRLAGLIALNFLSSTLCWLPMIILDLPAGLPLFCVSLSAFLSAFLNPKRWPVIVLSSTIGTLVGFCGGYALWWPQDPIGGAWVPIIVPAGTILAAVVAMVSGAMGSRFAGSDQNLRKIAWLALWVTAALGPACLALVPLAAHRVARNHSVAATLPPHVTALLGQEITRWGLPYRNAVQSRQLAMALETTYTSLREDLASVLDRVADDREVVIVRRRGAKDVALIAASELAGLLETAHLLRSPKNAQRLLAALRRAEKGLGKSSTVEKLRRETGLEPSA